MSEFLTSNFFYAPDYKTQCVQIKAQAAKVPRGTIICVKGSAPTSASFSGTAATISPTATFTGTEASLSGDAESYTPAGTVEVTGASYTPVGTISLSGAAASDGTYDIIGAGDGSYAQPYGILLNDAPASASAQTVDIVVIGELFKEYVNGVYKAAHGDNSIPAPIVDALRCSGIILK